VPPDYGGAADGTLLAGALEVAPYGDWAIVRCSSTRLSAVNMATAALHSFVDAQLRWTVDQPRHAVFGDYAVCGFATITPAEVGVVVVDISDPTNMSTVTTQLATYGAGSPWFVLKYGNLAIVSYPNGDSIETYDMTDPTAPSLVSAIRDLSLQRISKARGLDMSGVYLLVCNRVNHRLAVVDYTTPSSPSIVGSLTDSSNMYGPQWVKAYGNYAFVWSSVPSTDHYLLTVDISTKSAPVVDSRLASTADARVTGLRGEGWIIGTELFVAKAASILVFDISDPQNVVVDREETSVDFVSGARRIAHHPTTSPGGLFSVTQAGEVFGFLL
jgi:hypothetical protein